MESIRYLLRTALLRICTLSLTPPSLLNLCCDFVVVRRYFGERIAFYFLWLGVCVCVCLSVCSSIASPATVYHCRLRPCISNLIVTAILLLAFYTRWLYVPAALGIVIFIYGLGSYMDQPDAAQVCNSTFKICPLCADCGVTDLVRTAVMPTGK